MTGKIVAHRAIIAGDLAMVAYELATIHNALVDLHHLEQSKKLTHWQRDHIATVRMLYLEQISELVKDSADHEIPF